MIKQNKYIIDKTWKRIGIFLVLPYYTSVVFDKRLGSSWDIGVSLSLGGTSVLEFRIGFIFGSFTFITYKKNDN